MAAGAAAGQRPLRGGDSSAVEALGGIPAEWKTEFRYAENLNKTILVARLEPLSDTNITSEWQRCDVI